MALKVEKEEPNSDCEDSDASIELTDDDKNYIERLMAERYGFKTNIHKDKFKCILPCHICDKIQLSANPESTNKFLDIIFMEHENDFEFTKEKRRKIIQSLVHDYIETESKKEEDKKPRKIKSGGSKIRQTNVTRKSLITHSYNRYSAIPHRIRKTIRIIPERKTRLSKNDKVKNISDYSSVKKEVRPISKIGKLESQASRHNKYNMTYHKVKGTKETSAENKHILTKNLKNGQTPCETVLKIEVKPNSIIRKIGPHESQSNKSKINPLKILGTKRNYVESREPHAKDMNSCKTSSNREVKPVSVIRQVEPENKENVFLLPSCPVQKPKFNQRQNYKLPLMQMRLLVPMKDPRSPFHIPEDYMDTALYQQGLALQGWNPTQVLYEICGYCGWGKPEFLEGGNVMGGFLCCVRVRNCSFMARIRGQTKKIARHLASTQFLNQIGFRFMYNVHSLVPMKSIDPYSDEKFVFPRGITVPGAPKY